MKAGEAERLDQFDQFTLKITAAYASKYGLSPTQTGALRNDYLWARYASTCTSQFEQEWKNRVMWRDHLFNGPMGAVPAQVPGVGSEFTPPTVPVVLDGILPRWRAAVAQIKSHVAYEKADGVDLGIHNVSSPSQRMKPEVRCYDMPGHGVYFILKKDGHTAVTMCCRRGADTQPVKVGVFTRARFFDRRPNLVPGQPEMREYTFQYMDGDELVGQISDVSQVMTQGAQAVA